MRYRLLAMALALVALLGPANAQSNREEDRPASPTTMEFSVGISAVWASGPYLASLRCGIGDPEKWRQIFSAMDRRIRYCAERHSEWETIRQEALSHARQEGVLGLLDDGLAEARFRAVVAKIGKEMDTHDRTEFCAHHQSALWRDILAPGSVPPAEAAAAWQEETEREGDNIHYCGRGLCPRFFRDIRHWGEEQSWVTAPCANLFPGK